VHYCQYECGEFAVRLHSFPTGLRVVHIAALQLVTCEINQGIKEVLEDPKLIGFDYVPVLSRKRIFGIVERKRAGNVGTVKENMRALDDSLLVSADEPLTSFVSCLRTDPFRLVVKGTEIKGIVTRSDLIKLPVRLSRLYLPVRHGANTQSLPSRA
jgi:predicted transcriptional regulator